MQKRTKNRKEDVSRELQRNTTSEAAIPLRERLKTLSSAPTNPKLGQVLSPDKRERRGHNGKKFKPKRGPTGT